MFSHCFHSSNTLTPYPFHAALISAAAQAHTLLSHSCASAPHLRMHRHCSSGLKQQLSTSLVGSTRMGKTKRKAESLQPCSTKKELNRDGLVAIGDEEELGEKELNSIQKLSHPTMDEVKNEDGEVNLCGIPLSLTCKDVGAGATFVLEKASLTLAYIGKRYQILNSNEHAGYLRKRNLDPYKYRPDIVHEALRQIIVHSRLRMAGRVKAVYIRTEDGVLIKVEPFAQIPSSLESFCSMMAELLQTLSIKVKGNRKKLLRVVANPVTKYLSPTSRKIGLSFSSEKAVELREYVGEINSDEDVVFVVGVMAHGKIECDYIEDLVSVYPFHLTAADCLEHICIAMDRKWSVW